MTETLTSDNEFGDLGGEGVLSSEGGGCHLTLPLAVVYLSHVQHPQRTVPRLIVTRIFVFPSEHSLWLQ